MNKLPTKGAAFALALFLGFAGAHQFYLKRYNVAVIWLLACIFLSWTVAVPFILWGIALIQGVRYLFYKQEDWEKAVS